MLNCMGSLATLRCRNSGVGILRFTCDYKPAGSFRCGRESASIRGGVRLNKPIFLSGSSRPRLMLPRCGGGGGDGDGDGDELMVVGFSHGWVAMFNKLNNDLFLLDPVSHRIIKLPPIHTLPDPDLNLDLDGRGTVSKVILSSSSPDDDDCRAMMTFGPANRLAFCLPGRSSEWTPIGDYFFRFFDYEYPFERIAKVHEDLVYCTRQKVFTSITAAHLNLLDLRFDQCGTTDDRCYIPEKCDWDIEDPTSPKLVRTEMLYVKKRDQNGRRTRIWLEENIELMENECIQIPHIVYAEHCDEVFVVIQFVRLMSGEGVPLGFVPTCELKGLNGVFRGQTFGFIVMEMKEDRGIRSRENARGRHVAVVDDLKGMAMFVGINHSFAIEAGDELKLKPNSIYFNDSKRIKRVCGVNDKGIFNYATKTISSAPTDQNGIKINHSFASSALRLLFKPNSAERIARVFKRATAAQPH